MPIYEYACEICKRHFEARQSVALRDTARCACGCRAMKVFTPTANVFVHDHFRVMQSDFLPEKGDAAWADLQGGTGSQVRKPREQTFTEYFDEQFKGC